MPQPFRAIQSRFKLHLSLRSGVCFVAGTEMAHRNRGHVTNFISVKSSRCTLLLALVLASLMVLSGCGGGGLSFDGGHVPIGGGAASSRVTGQVFLAENNSAPLPNATVTVTNVSVQGTSRSQSTTSAADGTFTFDKIPDTSSVNQYLVSVLPPAGSDRIAQQLSFAVNSGVSLTVLVAMPRLSFNQLLPAAVSLSPAGLNVHTGDTIRLSASVLDSSGAVLPVTPSLVFFGNFGILLPNGLFESTGAGTGSVSIFWDTGTTLLRSNSASIVADTTTSYQPPPPPIIMQKPPSK